MVIKDLPLAVAVLGDTHGQFPLALTLLRRWEEEHGRRLDLILQVGDAGIWPRPLISLDDSTRRFAQKNPDAVSFAGFYDGSSVPAALFFGPDAPDETRIEAPFLFVRGNHEDFDFLESQARFAAKPLTNPVVPVDFHERMWYLPDGETMQFSARGRSMKIGGLGGLQHGRGQIPFHNRDRNRLGAEFDMDVVLTHEPPYGVVEGRGGSHDILGLLSTAQPHYHFCGHWHITGRPLDVEGTNSYLMEEVKFIGAKRLTTGCIGILEWDAPNAHSFSFLDEAWMGEYTRRNYRGLVDAHAHRVRVEAYA